MEKTVDISATNKPVQTPAATAPPEVDVEAQSSSTAGVQSIVRKWKRVDLMKKGSLILRGSALIFSLLSFIIMACNKHGGGGNWMDFDTYEEYRYLLAIAILSTLYTAAQVSRQLHQLINGKEVLSQRTADFLDFFGDQILAYLLISAASTAIPRTNQFREGVDNIFTDSSAASISMAFFAFLALALCAMISAYKLSHQSYI
ncbi:hypothetical protein AQUCO_07200066v1 [Aquilegia coerulea]|uniref:CASP-like protein n=1 Tax=Aquilegia coerulea TaxID=218851 RepID=A0A2G5CA84_AQUCA|nr:hypothetical protein AQUCO_07200066v1 [Aquilegia coerulea]